MSPSPDQHDVALAIDIGGSMVKMGLISRDGTASQVRHLRTPPSAKPADVANVILAAAHEILDGQGGPQAVSGTGVSIAAFVTPDGLVTATAHFDSATWVGVDLGQLLADLPGPLAFALDSPAPGLGEAHFGAGRGARTLAYVTVSTGIGAAIIQDGRHWGGGVGWAGGLGHSIIDERSPRVCPGCRNHGCLETFAARHGIVASALEMAAAEPGSVLASLAREGLDAISPRDVAWAAMEGDVAAAEVLRSAGHALGIGLTNLIDIVAPDRVVVGGGISLAGDLLLEPARAVVRERAFPPVLRNVPVVAAGLGDLSGLYGAATLILLSLRVEPSLESLS